MCSKSWGHQKVGNGGRKVAKVRKETCPSKSEGRCQGAWLLRRLDFDGCVLFSMNFCIITIFWDQGLRRRKFELSPSPHT